MDSSADAYKSYAPGSQDLVNRLVEEHRGWAASIARSVARAWNLDWELDGLDGGANEALLFCARRYDPAMGVPFRAYARRRIHESSTEEARKSKSWQRGVGANTQEEQDAREISARLFDVFPELRTGELPLTDGGGGDDTVRSSVRQLLASATMIAALQELTGGGPEAAVDYKRMVQLVAELEPVHQSIIWGIYYQGMSMRSIATDWGIDELNVIREHQLILQYVFTRISDPKRQVQKLKVRPGLRTVAQTLKKKKEPPPFSRFAVEEIAGVIALLALTIGVRII